MARFTTDLARGYPPTSVALFYDGGDAAVAARIARYRAAAGARVDLLWRDLRHCPEALSLFGVAATAGGFFVKDRHARLFAGLGARLVLWREIDAYRWRAFVLGMMGVAALLARPITPHRGALRVRAREA